MKILFFIDNLGPGGKQRRLVELIKGLLKYPDVELILVLTEKEVVYSEIFTTGIKIYYTIRSSKRDISVFFEFNRIVKNIKPDLIHVWGNLEAIYALPAKILNNIPLINGQITNASKKITGKIYNHKLTFPFSNRIIANSFAGLNSYNAPNKKSTVIYNGFDFNRINNLEEKSLIKARFNIKTKFIVGMVGSFSDRKDYTTYIKAINNIFKSRNDITFLCIGDGNFNNYKNLVDKKYIQNVRFLHHQSNVESIMNICDIGVLATFTEGISNALLEFMALEKSVVVAGGGGCREIVLENENGFLLNSGDFIELADKISILLEDSNLRRKFGKASKKIVKTKFSIDKMINSFYMEYKLLLQK